MTNRRLKITLAIASALLAGHSAAQEDNKDAHKGETHAQSTLPDGFAVLDRHAEAIGGEERNKEIKGLRVSGSFKMPVMNIDGSIIISSKAPASTLIQVDLGVMGQVIQGTNGSVVWASQPGMETQVIEGAQADQLKHQARFYAAVEPRETYSSAETVGIVDHKGTKCYKVNLVTTWDQHEVALYEVESGLLRKVSIRANAETDLFTNETEFSDYKEVEGVMYAHTIELLNNGIQQFMAFDTIEVDPEFDKGLFTPPGAL